MAEVVGRVTDIPVLAPIDLGQVQRALTDVGVRIGRRVDFLWPSEADAGRRAGALAEEVGEVIRATTKRRHAQHAANGLCKGLDVDQWTEELATELAQAAGIILDMAQREGIDLWPRVLEAAAALERRRVGD